MQNGFSMNQIVRALTNPMRQPMSPLRPERAPFSEPGVDPPDADLGLEQAIAEEHYYASQIQSGYQIFNKGGIETAADYQNLMAYQNSLARPGLYDRYFDDPFTSQMGPGYYRPDHDLDDPLMGPGPLDPMNPARGGF